MLLLLIFSLTLTLRPCFSSQSADGVKHTYNGGRIKIDLPMHYPVTIVFSSSEEQAKFTFEFWADNVRYYDGDYRGFEPNECHLITITQKGFQMLGRKTPLISHRSLVNNFVLVTSDKLINWHICKLDKCIPSLKTCSPPSLETVQKESRRNELFLAIAILLGISCFVIVALAICICFLMTKNKHRDKHRAATNQQHHLTTPDNQINRRVNINTSNHNVRRGLETLGLPPVDAQEHIYDDPDAYLHVHNTDYNRRKMLDVSPFLDDDALLVSANHREEEHIYDNPDEIRDD